MLEDDALGLQCCDFLAFSVLPCSCVVASLGQPPRIVRVDAPPPSRQVVAADAGVLECIENDAIDETVGVARSSSRMDVSSRAFVVEMLGRLSGLFEWRHVVFSVPRFSACVLTSRTLAAFHAAVRTAVSIKPGHSNVAMVSSCSMRRA